MDIYARHREVPESGPQHTIHERQREFPQDLSCRAVLHRERVCEWRLMKGVALRGRDLFRKFGR